MTVAAKRKVQTYKPQKLQFFVWLYLNEVNKIDELAQMANVGQGVSIARIVELALNTPAIYERVRADFVRAGEVQKGVENKTFQIQCRVCLQYVQNVDMATHQKYHIQRKIALPLQDIEKQGAIKNVRLR